MKLLEIPRAIDDAIDFLVDPETGEIKSEAETMQIIEALEGERLAKIKWLGMRVINKTAERDALKDHKRSIDARISAADAEIERLKRFIGMALEYEKFTSDDGLVKISYRKTANTVRIDDVAAIPDEFFKAPHTVGNVSKTAIKEKILAGENVPGAHLEDNTSVIIK